MYSRQTLLDIIIIPLIFSLKSLQWALATLDIDELNCDWMAVGLNPLEIPCALPTIPSTYEADWDAIISSQVLPPSPKPIHYANMYFHCWLHWMNDRIIVIDDVHSTRCVVGGRQKRSNEIPNPLFITQNQYKPPLTAKKQSIGLR